MYYPGAVGIPQISVRGSQVATDIPHHLPWAFWAFGFQKKVTDPPFPMAFHPGIARHSPPSFGSHHPDYTTFPGVSDYNLPCLPFPTGWRWTGQSKQMETQFVVISEQKVGQNYPRHDDR